MNSLIWIQFLWLVCPHNKDDNIPKHCFKTKQSLHLVASLVHQIPSCCFRASEHSHLELNVQYFATREPQTVLEITSVGTQIMVHFFPGCAQLYFSKGPSEKMVINATAYLKASIKRLLGWWSLIWKDTRLPAVTLSKKLTQMLQTSLNIPLIIN